MSNAFWLRRVLSVFLLISTHAAYAQNAASLLPAISVTEQAAMRDRAAGRVDARLVGQWVGNAAAKNFCAAYAWRTERANDGSYHLYYFDESQTLLDDRGFWWVDAAAQYHEFSTQTQESPSIYRYQLSDKQAVFKNDTAIETLNDCDVAEFTEQKINLP